MQPTHKCVPSSLCIHPQASTCVPSSSGAIHLPDKYILSSSRSDTFPGQAVTAIDLLPSPPQIRPTPPGAAPVPAQTSLLIAHNVLPCPQSPYFIFFFLLLNPVIYFKKPLFYPSCISQLTNGRPGLSATVSARSPPSRRVPACHQSIPPPRLPSLTPHTPTTS